MQHLFATAISTVIMVALLFGADYILYTAFGWPLNHDFNAGMALGVGVGFYTGLGTDG